jgi:hypothetical protein
MLNSSSQDTQCMALQTWGEELKKMGQFTVATEVLLKAVEA